MEAPDYYTLHEIQSQSEAWAEALQFVQTQTETIRGFLGAGRFDAILVTGCGSTYYLSLAAAALAQELTGLPSRAVPASEVWLNPRSSYLHGQNTLLIAVSRSGETTETLRACESFRAQGKGDILTLSCYPGRALTQAGGVNLVFPSGQETSFAQTRAFTTLYLAAASIAAIWAGRDDLLNELPKLPDVCRREISRYAELARELGSDGALDRFYFLGSGPRHGLACELSLKMKEMSLSHSEPFHFLEFRHGPKSMATDSALIVGLASESNAGHERAVLDDMRKLGARVLAMGESGGEVAFESGLSEAIRDVLYLPVGQLLAFERALHKGLNPDRPHNLDAVVKLDNR